MGVSISIFGGKEVQLASAPTGTEWSIAFFGGQKLDYRQASFPQDKAPRIIIVALFGGVDIRVPPGTQVTMDGFRLFGGSKVNVEPGNQPGGKLRVSAWCIFGGTEVSSKAD
jgi:hypothetical protein